MTGSDRTAPHALAGIALLVAAVACFAVLDTTTKLISASIPVMMALWFRYAFQAIATTAVILPIRHKVRLRTDHPKFQFLRGLLLLSTSVFAYFGLQHMPVGEFTAIVMITPLVITLLASVTLSEKVSWVRWVLVIGGFAGTLIIIRPDSDDFNWAMLLPLGLVASNAGFQILTSRLARTENPLTTHFYTGWVATLVTSVALPFVWVHLDSATLWISLAIMGLMGAVGHFMMILAYGRAPASTLTPFLYAQIGFAMVGGWVMFSHVPDQWAMLGMVTIAVCGAAGAWLAVRESRVAIEPVEA